MIEPVFRLSERLSARFGERALAVREALGQVTMEVAPEHLIDVARSLRDDRELRFEVLTDLCAVDYLGYGEDEWETRDVTDEGFSRGVDAMGPGRFDWANRPRGTVAKRFAVVVHLLSIANNQRVRIKSYCADDSLPQVPSLVDIWPASNWFEREAFDLYGVLFEGHPDLRRLLTDYGFVGHPFRKDFPLIGNVEVIYDPEQQRVVYKPVSIEPRVLVPRTIRDDSRYLQGQAEQAERQGK